MKKTSLALLIIASVISTMHLTAVAAGCFYEEWAMLQEGELVNTSNFNEWPEQESNKIMRAFAEKMEKNLQGIKFDCDLDHLDFSISMIQEIVLNAYEHQGDQLYSILPYKIACYLEKELDTVPKTKFAKHVSDTVRIYFYHISFIFRLFDSFLHDPNLQLKKSKNLVKNYSSRVSNNPSLTLDDDLTSLQLQLPSEDLQEKAMPLPDNVTSLKSYIAFTYHFLYGQGRKKAFGKKFESDFSTFFGLFCREYLLDNTILTPKIVLCGGALVITIGMFIYIFKFFGSEAKN